MSDARRAALTAALVLLSALLVTAAAAEDRETAEAPVEEVQPLEGGVEPLVAPAAARLPDAPAGPVRPWELDSDGLRAEGWEFLDDEGRPGRPVAGLVAIVPGIALHGAGHWVLGERQIAVELLIRQAIGLGAGLTAALLRPVARDSAVGAGAVQALSVAAWGGLAANWLADGYGAFRGTLSGTSEVSPPPSLSAGAAWTFLNRQDGGTLAGGQLFLRWDNRFSRLHDPSGHWLGVHADLSANSYWMQFMADAGYAFAFKEGAQSSFALRVRAGEEAIMKWSSGRTIVEPGISARLEFGDRLPHLRGMYWETRVGAELSWWWFESDASRHFQGKNFMVRIPSEAEIGLLPGSQLELALIYRERYDPIIGRIGALGPFHNIGSFEGVLRFVAFSRIKVSLQAELGEATRLILGVALQTSTNGDNDDL